MMEKLDELAGETPSYDPDFCPSLVFSGVEGDWVLAIPLPFFAENVSLFFRVRWGGRWGITYMLHVKSQEWMD